MNNAIYLQALTEDQKGNWEQAHDLIQDLSSPEAAWIHAYLHRKRVISPTPGTGITGQVSHSPR
ncbi:hypothetical protein [Marinoscillum sp.]|uniref:hypothetical protein n=1 Tax=Marinoscillum sp. TaxID=2024838 RepID=UPI003BAD4D8E